MATFIGQTIVKQSDIEEFKNFSKSDWAMYFIECYGQIDGSHHKSWVLDQVAQILKGTPIIIHLAKWDNGKEEYRVSLADEKSPEYIQWKNYMLGEFDETEQLYEYDYDEGIAP